MEALRILIVEDNLIEATHIRQTMEKAGHTVTEIARNFREAIQGFRQHLPDIVLIDINLEAGSSDGISIAIAIQKIRSTPVVYLTANSEYETFRRAKETLPAAYLLKPFRHTELAFQVELAYYHHLVNLPPLADDLFLPVNKGHERIAKNKVVFMKAEGAYVRVFMADSPDESYLLSMNLGYLSQFFTMPNFHRLSRSLLINLDYLERFERSKVFMKYHDEGLPLPESNRAELMKKLMIVKSQ